MQLVATRYAIMQLVASRYAIMQLVASRYAIMQLVVVAVTDFHADDARCNYNNLQVRSCTG